MLCAMLCMTYRSFAFKALVCDIVCDVVWFAMLCAMLCMTYSSFAFKALACDVVYVRLPNLKHTVFFTQRTVLCTYSHSTC